MQRITDRETFFWHISYSEWSEKSALSPTFFNFDLDYAFKEVQENRWVLKLNETGHVPFYTDHVDLLGENVNFIKIFVGKLS